MERIDLTIDTKNDKNLYGGTYVTAYEVDVLKRIKTVEIQRYVRYSPVVAVTTTGQNLSLCHLSPSPLSVSPFLWIGFGEDM